LFRIVNTVPTLWCPWGRDVVKVQLLTEQNAGYDHGSMNTVRHGERSPSLPIRTVINARGFFTALGGGAMPPEVIESMASAAAGNADLWSVLDGAADRLAELTGNQAAWVTAGGAAGLLLAAASCARSHSPSRSADGEWPTQRRTVVVQETQWNPYATALWQAGVRVVRVGRPEGVTPSDLERAVRKRPAMVAYFAGLHYAKGAVSLPDVLAITKEAGVPVVVDAADLIPPRSNLSHFTRILGADLAIFSGGKGLRGPQASGLVVGRADLVGQIRELSAPNHGLGRPMKVSKEAAIGLCRAVELSLAVDEDLEAARAEALVELVIAAARKAGADAERRYPLWTGVPLPWAAIRLDLRGPWREMVVQELFNGQPAIAVGESREDDAVMVNPQAVSERDVPTLIARVEEVLRIVQSNGQHGRL
jgi:seryl-tRNA(Sec) selenium transferase